MKTLNIKDIKKMVKEKENVVSLKIGESTVNVKQHLSIVDKINFVESCLISGLNDVTGIVNRNSIEISKVIFITKFYTDIKVSNDNIENYDLLTNSGVYSKIVKEIPSKEIKEIELLLENQIRTHCEENLRINSIEIIIKKGIEDLKTIITELAKKLPDEIEMDSIVHGIRDTLDGASPENLEIINGLIKQSNKN